MSKATRAPRVDVSKSSAPSVVESAAIEVDGKKAVEKAQSEKKAADDAALLHDATHGQLVTLGDADLKAIAVKVLNRCKTAQTGEDNARELLVVALLDWYEANAKAGTHLKTFKELKDMVEGMAGYNPIEGIRVPAFDRVVELVVKTVLVDQSDKLSVTINRETGKCEGPANVIEPTVYDRKAKSHVPNGDHNRAMTDKEVKAAFNEQNGKAKGTHDGKSVKDLKATIATLEASLTGTATAKHVASLMTRLALDVTAGTGSLSDEDLGALVEAMTVLDTALDTLTAKQSQAA